MDNRRKNVQSVLFKKSKWNAFDAIERLKSLGFNYKKLDIKKNYYRFRQFDPDTDPGIKYITVKSKNHPGILYIIEYEQKS